MLKVVPLFYSYPLHQTVDRAGELIQDSVFTKKKSPYQNKVESIKDKKNSQTKMHITMAELKTCSWGTAPRTRFSNALPLPKIEQNQKHTTPKYPKLLVYINQVSICPTSTITFWQVQKTGRDLKLGYYTIGYCLMSPHFQLYLWDIGTGLCTLHSTVSFWDVKPLVSVKLNQRIKEKWDSKSCAKFLTFFFLTDLWAN